MIGRKPDRAASGPDRGQTTLDFAVAMGIFLTTVLFVLAYAPTMFDPFAGGTGTKLVVADRAATTLSADVLAASTAQPGVLSKACVVGFFEDGGDQGRIDSECPAEINDVTDLDETLSLDGRNANVTVHKLERGSTSTPDPLTFDWNDGDIDWSGDSIELARQNSGSIETDVAVATRTVSIEGEQYRLTVRVW
jgi:hypothetical protein